MTASGRLYKREKLCSLTAIDTLFDRSAGSSAVTAFPLRAVWRRNTGRGAGVQFLVSVPKKRLRHAVDRVAVRRRVREAYRLHRDRLGEVAAQPVDVAFIFLGDRVTPSPSLHAAMQRLLDKIAASSAAVPEQ